MELHSPLKYRKNQRTIITQPFGVNYENYKHHGIKGHNGIDFVNGHQMNCYGIGIVAAHKGRVVRVVADEPMSTKGNGVYVQTREGDLRYKSVYWHLSEVLVRAGDLVKQGQLIGRMGNSGTVRPKPTERQPYLGTHLHFGLYLYRLVNGRRKAEDNDYRGAIDPMPLFSEQTKVRNFREQLERPSIDRLRILIAPLIWAIKLLKVALNKRKRNE